MGYGLPPRLLGFLMRRFNCTQSVHEFLELSGINDSGDRVHLWNQLVEQHSLPSPRSSIEELLGVHLRPLAEVAPLQVVTIRHSERWSRTESNSHLR